MTDAGGKVDLFVLGGGPGGYAAAFAAADQGLRVALCDLEANPGGVCLYRGCIPSKALLHAAALVRERRLTRAMGIDFAAPAIDIGRLRQWKEGVVLRLTGGLGGLARMRQIHYLRGRGTILSPHLARVAAAGGSLAEIAFDHLVIATGSRPVLPPELDIGSPRVADPTAALALQRVPPRLLVVGGGYVGTEIATIYAALGARVTLVELTAGLLPGMDRELVRLLEQKIKGDIAELMPGTRVVAAEDTGEAVRVQLSNGATQEFDQVFVATGRSPVTDGFGLEHSGVRLDARGFVEVDAAQRTAAGTVYAVGDLTGPPLLAHKAASEGRTAAAALAGLQSPPRPRAIPSVVYTDPQIAWCGLSEAQAQAEGRRVRSVAFPWAASGRAWTEGRPDGLTKLVVDEQSDTLLGIGIAGKGAGELIAEGVLAVELGLRVQDLARAVHPHPTLSETLMEAAELYAGHSTHYYGRQRVSGDRMP